MQLVPLSTDGRVTVVVTAPLPSGPLRVALRMDAENVVIEALGPTGSRRVGRFTDADAAAYRPVVARLAARGQAGTCPARMVDTGDARALILHLGSPATCAPRDQHDRPAEAVPHSQTLLATARTIPAPGGGSGVPVRPAARAVSTAAGRPSPTARGDGRIDLDATGARRPASRPTAGRGAAARFGQLDDAPPRLTRDQRRRVLWATIGIAAALLLASVLQHGVSAGPAAEGAAACAEGSPTCGPRTPS